MPPRAGATKRAFRSTSRRPSRSRVITIRGSDDDLGIAVLAGPGNLVTTNDVSGVGGSGIAVNYEWESSRRERVQWQWLRYLFFRLGQPECLRAQPHDGQHILWNLDGGGFQPPRRQRERRERQ